ncbi:MAG: DeoR/GlpR transcriptional regulator [Lentisphaerae bacterium]|nr:DeoR/GlpR transcriptional regulator [Lentisphaerota bacterium]MCP4102621.1 DeoR/GlpR transcriptional regulator [Lentisphaerota bacterium]
MSEIIKNRQDKIISLLMQSKELTVQRLSEELDVSVITIRRDLNDLAQKGFVDRKYGSATLKNNFFGIKNTVFAEEKEIIGKYAASLVSEGDIVLMNSGSTVLHLLYSITQQTTVVTNNLAINFSKCNDNLDLIILGGEYRKKPRSLIGDITLQNLSNIHSSITFLGVNGIHPKHGLSTLIHQEVPANKQIIKQSNGKIYVIADHSKLGKISNFHTESIDKIDAIITDSKVSKSTIKQFNNLGTEVIVAKNLL